MAIRRPTWFSDTTVMVSTAPTCGLTKGGRLLPKVDRATGKRIQAIDPETGESVDAIDDQLLADMESLTIGNATDTLRFIDRNEISLRCAVPVYYDFRFVDQFRRAIIEGHFPEFRSASLRELTRDKVIEVRGGHGSPSQDQRVGEVPYIKVSDLRAGLVNINPTNRVPRSVAEAFWGGTSSGLRAYDLLCPERTSKNIGDFCVLMPGQEQVVTTKEVIVIRPGPAAQFDAFYLLWALTLKIVRNQWKRIVFMQTNREDVGKRYLEIEIPIAPSRERAEAVSEVFRKYYLTVAEGRKKLQSYLLSSDDHHFFVSGAEEPESSVGDTIPDPEILAK